MGQRQRSRSSGCTGAMRPGVGGCVEERRAGRAGGGGVDQWAVRRGRDKTSPSGAKGLGAGEGRELQAEEGLELCWPSADGCRSMVDRNLQRRWSIYSFPNLFLSRPVTVFELAFRYAASAQILQVYSLEVLPATGIQH